MSHLMWALVLVGCAGLNLLTAGRVDAPARLFAGAGVLICLALAARRFHFYLDTRPRGGAS